MRAIIHTRYGTPDVLSLAEVPTPTPAPDEVLIEVHAAAINRTDIGFRQAAPFFVRVFSGLRRPKYTILGTEVAGVVTAVGADVTKFAIGDRVFGVNANHFGTHAEYVCMKQTAPLAKMPDAMSFVDGAGMCDGMILAINCIRRMQLGPQHRLVIHGSSGAIGTAAVQLARHAGAHVTAVCGPDQLVLMKELGADEVIDRTTTDFTAIGRQWDIVFDAVGKLGFRHCAKALVKRGLWVTTDLGSFWQNPLLALVTRRLPMKTATLPIPPYRQADVELLAQMWADGQYRAVIDRAQPMEEFLDATRYVESEQKIGNVVLTMR